MKIHTEQGQYWGGLGDTICLAWMAEGSKDSADPITLVAKAGGIKSKILDWLQVPQTEDGSGALIPSDCYKLELMDNGKQARLEYLRTLYNIQTSWKRPTLAVSDEARQWATDKVKQLGGPPVLLFPQTHWKPREWAASYWIDLAWKLHNRKIPTLVMLDKDEERFERVPNRVWGHPLDKVAALMQASRYVVGNDSMPAHLAGTVTGGQGSAKTLALMGPTKGSCVFGHDDGVECMGSEALDCTGCHFKRYLFRAACDQGCMSLMTLTSDAVFGRLAERLGL